MRRAERRRAEHLKETPRTLHEIDYLLLVDDEAREGALRFAEREGGSFLKSETHTRIPAFVKLSMLLSATNHILEDKETDEEFRLLLAPGSSLGGARPKAALRDKDGALALAKFPKADDEISTVLWEAVALKLAESSGIEVPKWRLERVGKTQVLILKRFDRIGKERIPFLSAMSMLGAKDNETRSYLEFVDILRSHGASPEQDMHALWRRIVFNILISNTDDHLRNHGFLWSGTGGWKLAPAYDLNPMPVDIKPRVLSTTIDYHDGTASLELALSVASHFKLSITDARKIASEIGKAVSKWRSVAAKFGLSAHEIDRMASGFEHEDLALATSLISHPN